MLIRLFSTKLSSLTLSPFENEWFSVVAYVCKWTFKLNLVFLSKIRKLIPKRRVINSRIDKNNMGPIRKLSFIIYRYDFNPFVSLHLLFLTLYFVVSVSNSLPSEKCSIRNQRFGMKLKCWQTISAASYW